MYMTFLSFFIKAILYYIVNFCNIYSQTTPWEEHTPSRHPPSMVTDIKIILDPPLVQNQVAKIIYWKRKYEHVTPLLRSLHWLPVDKRIKFKIILFTYKCLHGMAPVYLSDLLTYHQSKRSLRSSDDTTLLTIQKSRLATYGYRAFVVIAPRLWNKLPYRNIRQVDNLSKKT